MRQQLLWGLVMAGFVTTTVVCAPPTAAAPYLFNAIDMPGYGPSLRNLLDQATNLPSWTREVLKSDGHYIVTRHINVIVNGTVYLVFHTCDPHRCDDARLALMFAPDGTHAWGAVREKATISYLGSPNDAQQAVMNKALRTKIDMSYELDLPKISRMTDAIIRSNAK